MTFAEEGDDMLMGFKGGGLRLKECKILPALAGWRGDKSPEKNPFLNSFPTTQVRDRQHCCLNICRCIG